MTNTIPNSDPRKQVFTKLPPKVVDAMTNISASVNAKRDIDNNLPPQSSDPCYLKSYASEMRRRYFEAIASLEQMKAIATFHVQGEQFHA